MTRRVTTLAGVAVAALLLFGRAQSGPSRAASPEPRPDGYVPTAVATPEPRPDVPAGFVTPAPAGTPEPRDPGPTPGPTPCAGGERMGC